MILQEKSKSCTPYGCSPLTGGSNIQLSGDETHLFQSVLILVSPVGFKTTASHRFHLEVFFYSLIRLDTRETVIYSQIWVCCGGLHLALWLLPALMRKFRSRPVTAFQLRASTTFTTVLSRQRWAVPLITASLSAPDCNCFNHVKNGESKEGSEGQVTFPIRVPIDNLLEQMMKGREGEIKNSEVSVGSRERLIQQEECGGPRLIIHLPGNWFTAALQAGVVAWHVMTVNQTTAELRIL